MDMFKVPRPVQYPGKDIHGGQSGPTIDCGVNLPAYGRVYLSVNAVKVAARLLAFGSPEKMAEFEATVAAQAERIAELEAEVELMRPVFEAVAAYQGNVIELPTPPAAPDPVAA